MSKEIQPEDIWNKEIQDKIKEHIKSVSKNQSSEEILETELMAKKYTEEDMWNNDGTKDLYSKIENLIIIWNIDGTKTAGTLTRQIMELLNNKSN